jgi:hypothetical protein
MTSFPEKIRFTKRVMSVGRILDVIGQTAQATVTSSGTHVTLGFALDNSAVASVTDDGLVTGVANGRERTRWEPAHRPMTMPV